MDFVLSFVSNFMHSFFVDLVIIVFLFIFYFLFLAITYNIEDKLDNYTEKHYGLLIISGISGMFAFALSIIRFGWFPITLFAKTETLLFVLMYLLVTSALCAGLYVSCKNLSNRLEEFEIGTAFYVFAVLIILTVADYPLYFFARLLVYAAEVSEALGYLLHLVPFGIMVVLCIAARIIDRAEKENIKTLVIIFLSAVLVILIAVMFFAQTDGFSQLRLNPSTHTTTPALKKETEKNTYSYLNIDEFYSQLEPKKIFSDELAGDTYLVVLPERSINYLDKKEDTSDHNFTFEDCAVTYYAKYFKKDVMQERHYVIDKYNKKTAMYMSYPSFVEVIIHEYISGEEQNYDLLGSGPILEEYFVHFKTNKIERLR